MKITINYSNNLHFKAKTRNFDNILLDEPKSFHGTDIAPSPVEYILIGIGGCLSSTLAYCLQKRNIEFDDIETIVDGNLKHAQPHLNLRLTQVHVEINLFLKEDYDEVEYNNCINDFTKYCPVYDPVLNGIPIKLELKKK